MEAQQSMVESMCEQQTCQVVDPGQLDCSGSWLRHKVEPEPALVESLQTIGQLEPILMFSEAGRMRVLHGGQRVLACRVLGQPVLAFKTAAPETVLEAALIHLAANWGRGLSEDQRLLYLRAVDGSMSRQRLQTELFPALQVAAQSRQGRCLQAWLDLEPEWDDCLAKGFAPLDIAPLVSRLSAGERRVLLPCFQNLRWSKNNAVHLVQWLWEIRARDQIGLEALWAELDLSGLLDLAQDWSPKDRIQRILEAVHAKRYPHLSAMRERVQTTKQRLSKGHFWKVDHDPNFESTAVVLSRRLRREEDRETVAAELTALCQSSEWGALWAALSGEAEV